MIPVMAAAAAFNLVCTLHLQHRDGDYAPYNADLESVFHVNLNIGRWCEEPCSESERVRAFSNEKLFLRSDGEATVSEDDDSIISISRESGAYEEYVRDGNRRTVRKGTCKAAPFTGLPGQKF